MVRGLMWHRVRNALHCGLTLHRTSRSRAFCNSAWLTAFVFQLAVAKPAHAEEAGASSKAQGSAATAATPTKAGEPDPRAVMQSEKARVYFQRGRELAAQKRYGDACEAFERSLGFEAAIGTKFNLADCYEHVGRIASAQELFSEVALLAHAADEPERERVARERAAALEPRTAHLVVKPKVTPDDLEIRRNGVPIERGQWGKSLALDPGFYDVEASAGGNTWHQRVEIGGPGSTVWVLVPVLGGETAAAEAPGPRRELKAAPPPAQETRTVLAWDRAGPAVVGLSAVAVAGLAVGTGFALKYKSKNDEAEAICQSTVCTADDIAEHDQLVDDARASRTGMIVSYSVAGAAAIGVAAVIWGPWWRQMERVPAAVRAAPVIGTNGTWGLTAQGRF